MGRFDSWCRAAGILSFVAILVLSTVPGSLRPHVLSTGNFEHFAAYAGTAFLLCLGWSIRNTVAVVAGLSATAALMEVLQLWIPGRGAAVGNWIASSTGALAGALIAVLLIEVMKRLFVPRVG